MKILLVVTSLMGAGHLNRTLVIARALRAAGARPIVVSGGRDVGHLATGDVEILRLPPVWSDGVDYSRLLTPEGVADETYLRARRDALLGVFEDAAPEIVVTELWPFGRRNLSMEFQALAERAQGRDCCCRKTTCLPARRHKNLVWCR